MTKVKRTFCAGLQVLAAMTVAVRAPAAERIVWKPVEAAVLKVDDRPAKSWEVYRAEKKEHLLLVQLGARFLMLDTKAHEIYELDPQRLQRKGKELRWERTKRGTTKAQSTQSEHGEDVRLKPDATQAAKERTTETQSSRREHKEGGPRQREATQAGPPENLLPSTDWMVRDAGPAKLVRVRLVGEGRVLEVQLPQQPDLRVVY